MAMKSSLARSVGKLLGVFRNNDLSLRGQGQGNKFFDPTTDWQLLLNQAGPYSGTLDVTGHNRLLIFGVGGGAGGAAGGDDDGGGGGGGATGQFNGYELLVTPGGTYTVTVPGGGAAIATRGSDGNPGGDTTIATPTQTVFSLAGGAGAAQGPTNDDAYPAPATNAPPFASHSGGGGGIQEGRNVDRRPSDGTPGAYGGAGGGGGGAWDGPNGKNLGTNGLNNTLNTITVSSYDDSPLPQTFTVVGTNGTGYSQPTDYGQSTGPGAATSNAPASGAAGREYCGGGGAGGGVRFFGTGNGGYGAGGGGAGGQNPHSTPSGNGGAGYIVVYGRFKA